MTLGAMEAGRRHGLVFAIFFIAGCAHYTPPGARNNADISVWEGRLLVQVGGSVPQSLSASFTLHGNPDTGSLTLYTPLGTTAAHATWDALGARLQTPEQVYTAATLAELTRHLTGAELPITSLFDWLHGLNTVTPGWTVDLSKLAQGRLQAQRIDGDTPTQLRLVLER